MKDWLFRLFGAVWREGVVPEEWGDAVLVPVHKKGDALVCEMMVVAAKVLERVLLARLVEPREGRERE